MRPLAISKNKVKHPAKAPKFLNTLVVPGLPLPRDLISFLKNTLAIMYEKGKDPIR